MTGFAQDTITITDQTGHQTHLTISIKSLNSRFFEATCKLPYALTHLETNIIKKLRTHLRRGAVQCIMQMSGTGILGGSVSADLSLVKGYIDECKKIQKLLDIPGTVTINDIFNISDVFNIQVTHLNTHVQAEIMKTIEHLIDQVSAMRTQEGIALEADLLERIATIRSIMQSMSRRADIFMEQKKEEIIQKISTLTTDSDSVQPSVVNESLRNTLYFELNKIDIHEEITRFDNHLNTLHKQIQSDDIEKGRRLDFILQELAREINTIAAKCSDAQISSAAINIKVELEKAREQVQNIL